ncbi:MAG: carboxypeptidase regulatory-like domain-containing protein [Nitrospirae bacterium]|nr:carboxypeptidase regulatory-like domain-containing protein [Nitrospirota bacterium]
MSFTNPANRTLRRSVAGMEGMHSKMFDPPTESPTTPEEMIPTNPVPEVMAAAGLLGVNPPTVPNTVQRQLMHGMKLPTWDGQDMEFFVFRDTDGIDNGLDAINPGQPQFNPKQGSFPAPIIRVPRGCIYHCETEGSGPPPHTIHWHGQEPTPMNDGVGHCSMELGHYTYQWQPNFIGSYFYHCHRNTMQHFEFGLYGFTIIDPPDAFFASIDSVNPDGSVNLNDIPIGAGRDGKRRAQANLAAFPQFGQDNFNPIDSPDPEADNSNLPDSLKFATDPHAYTVPYDVEALWVPDDRDITWSNLASNARATFPAEGSLPGVNDNFYGNAGGSAGPNDFFAFNDFRSTHFCITGVPVPDDSGVLRIPGAGQLPSGLLVPPEMMSGVSGVQVSINAQVNQNILLRILCAAYNNIRVTFPVDIVIIAWDGRALGVPPYGNYNAPVLVPAGTPIEWSVARRFDCMIRSETPVNSFASVEFIDTLRRDVRFTARIPVNIFVPSTISGKVTKQSGAPMAGVTMTLTGPVNVTVTTGADGNYSMSGLPAGHYVVTPSLAGFVFAPANINVTLNSVDVIGADFVATQVAFAVSGGVTNRTGGPAAGVTINAIGPVNATTVTDASGNYSLAGLPNGLYEIIPSLAGFRFTPLSRDVTINNADVTGQNFLETQVAFAISGRVTDRSGNALPGVTMTLIGPVSKKVSTDASGNYSIPGLTNGLYEVIPSLAGFRFSPLSRDVTINNADATGRNFRGASRTR